MDQRDMPLFRELVDFASRDAVSFHVPGHKHGRVFPEEAKSHFTDILPLDLTEIPGMDDLHAPEGIIKQAEELAADHFGALATFFLIGGSTAGNLAMILAVSGPGEKVIVQRNSHKSIMNGLELAGSRPIFIAPDYDAHAGRYTSPSGKTLCEALERHPDAKAVILMYPDYFGRTYDLREMISSVHAYDIPVLVDEAHGVHFSITGKTFPPSATTLGADVVVQSAHKMAPAMTMGSYLHVCSDRVSRIIIGHYLQMLQSSSPSYPLLASLDIARAFLATIPDDIIEQTLDSVDDIRRELGKLEKTKVLSLPGNDDPLKLTLQMEAGHSAKEASACFEAAGIYPELVTHDQLLFIHGLGPIENRKKITRAMENIQEQLKILPYHDIIHVSDIFTRPITELACSYPEMAGQQVSYRAFEEAAGYIAAEAVIPYPPGIPVLLKGERIAAEHVSLIKELKRAGISIQMRNSNNQLQVFTGSL